LIMSEQQTAMPVQALRRQATNEGQLAEVNAGFGTLKSFELMMRQAKMLSSSTLVPTSYRLQTEVKEYGKVVGYEDNPSAISNCVIALNMASRMQADPLMVMQNLHMIEGRPSWSSQFIIAAINSCGRYSPLRFVISEPSEEVEVPYTATEWIKGTKTAVPKKVKVRHQTCYAWAIEKATGERLQSPMVSVAMAIAEGWLTKNGSKWQTMPDMMLRYRAASFFGRFYAPELLMGLKSSEEEYETVIIEHEALVPEVTPTNVESLRKPRKTKEVVDQAQDIADQTATDKPIVNDDVNNEVIDKSEPVGGRYVPTPEEEAEILRREQAEADELAKRGEVQAEQQTGGRRGRGDNKEFNLGE
jgi:hypothetical protein